jgi:hypothetical protein
MTMSMDYDDDDGTDDGLSTFHLVGLTNQDVVDLLADDADNDPDAANNDDVAGYNTGDSAEDAFRRMLYS